MTPTYQEADNITEFLRRVRDAVPDADILVVDDNSPDGTADLADQVATDLGRIDVLRRPKKIGLGDAYRAGFSVGIDRGYDVLVQIDADLSHDPAALPDAARRDLERRRRGDRLPLRARRIDPALAVARRAISKWGNRYTTFVLGMPIRDATSGYRAYRADMLKTVDYSSTRAKGYGFQMELAYRVRRHGGRIVEVPITFTDRVRGQSKITLSVAAEELALVTWWGVRDRVLRRRG